VGSPRKTLALRKLPRARETFAQMVSVIIQSVSKSVSKSVSTLVCGFERRGAGRSFAPPAGLGQPNEVEAVAEASR
jgi:hypothetical protein